jgi:hypothetical protein
VVSNFIDCSLCLVGLNQLAIQLDSKQARTSFGKLPLSDETTAPNFGFGNARRQDQAKVFLGELTVLENIAKGSPGPVYKYEDTVKYRDVRKILSNGHFLVTKILSQSSSSRPSRKAQVRLLRKRSIPR